MYENPNNWVPFIVKRAWNCFLDPSGLAAARSDSPVVPSGLLGVSPDPPAVSSGPAGVSWIPRVSSGPSGVTLDLPVSSSQPPVPLVFTGIGPCSSIAIV
jgi:hypothetical protein